MPHDPLTEIARKLDQGRLILFVGSGLSSPYFPTWRGLLEELQEETFAHGSEGAAEVKQMIEEKEFLNAAWAIQQQLGNAWRKYIGRRFRNNSADRSEAKRAIEHRYAALEGLPFASIVTTNYDDFLVKAHGNYITHEDHTQIARMPGECHLLKLHGDATKEQTLILTSTDYTKMKLGRAAVDEFMHSAAKGYSFLFLGYSFQDEDVLWWLERACYKSEGNVAGHFALVDGRKWGPYKRDLYRQRYGIRMVDAPLDEEGEYPDIAAWLRTLQAAYRTVQAAPVTALFRQAPVWPLKDEYVDPEVRARKVKRAKDDHDPLGSAQSLDQFLMEWLQAEDRRFLVLLGEFGTGKTQFSYRAGELVREHTKRTPVLVKLGQFHSKTAAGVVVPPIDHNAIATAAAPSQEEALLEANRNGALVLILDAFDEMGKADPAHTLTQSFEALTRNLVDGKAKVILTCRKELFPYEEDVDRIASDKVFTTAAEKVEVQLFDPPRIERALAQKGRAGLFAQVEANHRLMNLARRPVLLDLIAQHGEAFTPTTRLADLFENYIGKMLDRGPEDKLAGKRRKFAEKIAWQMQNTGPMPASALVKPLAEMGFEAEGDRFRSRSLLVRQVNDYVFGHASFREYLVARQVIPILKAGTFVECRLSDPTIEFIRELWEWPKPEILRGTGAYQGMMWIQPGPFIYGDGESACLANLEKGFWMDQYPVTNEQYLDFLKSVGKGKSDKCWIYYGESRITKALGLTEAKFKDHPVTGVSWFGAKAYADKNGKRLPTEMEWEKAARGVDGRRFPWGDEFDNKTRANTRESHFEDRTSSVSGHGDGRSPYGVFDIAGNVLEWTESDEYVLRGGSWVDNPEDARCAFRSSRFDPEFTFISIGFRCART